MNNYSYAKGADALQNKHISSSAHIDEEAKLHKDSVTIVDSCDIVDNSEKNNKSITTSNRHKLAHLIRRYCSKCETLIENVTLYDNQPCTECGTPMDFQCTRCNKQYNHYHSLAYHLSTKCSPESLGSSGIIRTCSHCKYRTRYKVNLHRHVREQHKDNSIKAHADSVAIGDASNTADDKEKDNMLITPRYKENRAELIRRYCSQCKVIVVDASPCYIQPCAICETLLDFQCARCQKQYNSYHKFAYHLNTSCNYENLDLKCTKCDYRTNTESLLHRHKKYCLSGIIYSCSRCEFTTKYRFNLYSHLRKKHEDIGQAVCSKCTAKPSKCKQCTYTTVPICENCHTGFDSTDKFLEHCNSCKR